MVKLNPYEERILRVLRRGRRALSTSQVASFSEIAFATAKNNLIKLNKKSLVSKKTMGNKIMWDNKN